MYKLMLILACLSAVALAGCADENPLSSAQVDQRERSSSTAGAERPAAKLTVSTYRVGGGWIKVMTRNLYLGASIN
jgi:outer membrane lipoprotein SlyB